MDVVDVGADELLEDAEQARDLAVGDDLVGSPAEEGLPEADEGRDVAPLLPERRREERAEQVRVGRRERVGRLELKKLRKDLEDVGHKL